MADPIQIPLRARDGSVRAHALIDASDAALARYRWHLVNNGYARGGRPRTQLHRAIVHLAADDRRQVDHINGDRLDCRRSNLRVVTRQQNAQNVPARGGTSRHRGVSWCKRTRRWQVTIRVAGKQIHLGRFSDENEAARVSADARARTMTHHNEARSVYV